MNAIYLDHVDSSFAEEVFHLYEQAWWCKDRDLASTKAVIEGSTQCFGLRSSSGRLIAFARVLSDKVEKATIYDVIVDGEFRGKGLGRQLMQGILSSPSCMNTRHIELYCEEMMIDYYATFGFGDITDRVKLLRRS